MYKVYIIWGNGKKIIGNYNSIVDAYSYMLEVRKYLYRLRKYYVYDLNEDVGVYTDRVLKNANDILNNEIIDLLKTDIMKQQPDVIVE